MQTHEETYLDARPLDEIIAKLAHDASLPDHEREALPPVEWLRSEIFLAALPERNTPRWINRARLAVAICTVPRMEPDPDGGYGFDDVSAMMPWVLRAMAGRIDAPPAWMLERAGVRTLDTDDEAAEKLLRFVLESMLIDADGTGFSARELLLIFR